MNPTAGDWEVIILDTAKCVMGFESNLTGRFRLPNPADPQDMETVKEMGAPEVRAWVHTHAAEVREERQRSPDVTTGPVLLRIAAEGEKLFPRSPVLGLLMTAGFGQDVRPTGIRRGFPSLPAEVASAVTASALKSATRAQTLPSEKVGAELGGLLRVTEEEHREHAASAVTLAARVFKDNFTPINIRGYGPDPTSEK